MNDRKKYYKDWAVKNKGKKRKYFKEWQEKNKKRRKEYKKNWRKENIKSQLEYDRKYNKIRRKNNPKIRLDMNLGSAIWLALNGKKARKRWEEVVGYTLKDLMECLEKRFDDKMDWRNYGSYWSVDHIKPKSLFHYEDAEDYEFKKCWALDNLQPLEKIENIKKSNHFYMEQEQLFKVRDLRKKDQYKIDDKYLNGYARIFGTTTTAVYNSLSRHAEFHTQEAFPSEELIAEEHGIGVKSVQRSIKQLKGANIIKVERVKRQGKWLNNNYFLNDKSNWRPPEDIKTLWRTKRKYTLPEDIKASLHRTLKPISTGHYDPTKDTHIKDNTLEGVAISKEIALSLNELIELFKDVNPSYKRLFSNNTQRKILQRLIDEHGEEKLKQIINTLPITNKMKFAPIITTPLDLENKLGKLIAFIQQQKDIKTKEIITTF